MSDKDLSMPRRQVASSFAVDRANAVCAIVMARPPAQTHSWRWKLLGDFD
jgi:hypothetical protein